MVSSEGYKKWPKEMREVQINRLLGVVVSKYSKPSTFVGLPIGLIRAQI